MRNTELKNILDDASYADFVEAETCRHDWGQLEENIIQDDLGNSCVIHTRTCSHCGDHLIQITDYFREETH